MSIAPDVLLAILGMAAATYAIRAGGLFLLSRATPGPFLEAWLKHIPGAMFVALVVPTVFAGGPALWGGAAATIVTARLGGPLPLSLALGVAIVALVRWLVPVP